MKGKLAILIVALMILPVATSIANAAYVDTITIKRIEDDAAAITSLQQGLTQARLFRVKDINLVQNLTQQGFQAIKAASGLINILVNPANVCNDGTFNIFSLQKARFALQFLINRQEIVTNIYKGYAIPVVGPWTPLDPDYPYLVGTLVKWQVIINSKGYDYGVQLLEEALQDAGATKGADDKWYIGDNPVTVKFVIRTEDARRDIGDALANTLESIGLTVERIYKDFNGAFEIVYSGNPADCQWHLYTEGWGITGMTKYDYGNFVWFYSSIWGGMPGWGEADYWNYKNETIDDIAQKLDSGDYQSVEEFWNLVNTGLELGIKESVRVFIVATYDFYLASGQLQGILPSPKASPWHTFTFMNLQYTEPEVVLSNRYVYKTGWSWNPVGGWSDFYSRPVVEAITFPSITSRLTDGETGWSPANVAVYTVTKGVEVPSDALYYDTVAHKFMTIGEGNVTINGTVNAVQITYKLLGKIKFHDGSTETIADLLAPLYIAFEYGTDTSTNETQDTRYESTLASQYSTLLNTFVGVKIVNETTVIVYTTYNHIDDGYIAQVASIWTSFPLELYAAMDLLWQYGSTVVGNQTVYYVFSIYSEDDNHTAIHLLDQVACDQMKNLLLNYKNTPPDWVQQLIDLGLLTLEEWQARVDNLVNFYDQHGHMVVGNGPFYLDSYDAANDVAVLKRVADFPVDVAEIAAELQPKTATIQISVPTIIFNVAGSNVANVTVTVNGQPATENDVILYVILLDVNTFNTIFANVTYIGNGQFQATLPSDVPTGDYKLIALAYPVGYSNPAMAEQSIAIAAYQPPSETPNQTEQPTNTTQQQPPAEQQPEQPTNETGAEQPQEGGNTGLIVAAIIVVIIIAAAAYYFTKK